VEGIKVLSVFDGMSCGQIALERAQIPVKEYYASEINKKAIAATKQNYPKTKHIGCVKSVEDFFLPEIDLFIGGSPCQGFSFAGKQLNFEDPRSKLFFEYVRILKEVKPRFFMLENVKMKKEYQNIISEHLGVEPVLINSALVSAQNRERLYWANFKIEPPEDSNLYVKDIADKFFDSNLLLTNTYKGRLKKSEGLLLDALLKNLRKVPSKNGLIAAILNDTPSKLSRQADRLYDINYKSPCLTASRSQDIKFNFPEGFRNLSKAELCRLQTVEPSYFDGFSRNSAAEMLGNGWTVDVIAHIFKQIPF